MRIITTILLSIMTFASTATAEPSYEQQFAVTLQAMGANTKTSSYDLQMALNELVATGSAPEDAFNLLMQVIKTPRVNPAAALRFAKLARDIGAARNESTAFWMFRMMHALGTGIKETYNFVWEAGGPNGMTAEQAGEIRKLAMRNSGAATDMAISIVEARFGGSFVALHR